MNRLTTAAQRLQQTHDLATVLDAACEAFEEILTAVCGHEDSQGMNIPLLLAATQAANGRDAVLFAPSLPARRLHQPSAAGESTTPAASADITAALAGLGHLLAARLTQTGAASTTAGDRTACQDAARCAQQIHDLLTGTRP